MKYAMCNEFCKGWPLEDAMKLACDTGYQGVEVAPFTVADSVLDVSPAKRDKLRTLAESLHIQLIGLHWLLVKPEGLSMNGPDADLRRKTRDYLVALVDFCADLGGDRMVIGSPTCRNVTPDMTYQQAWDNMIDTFTPVADHAATRNVNLCIEPLARYETNFITTVEEGVKLCKAMNHPNFKVHIDVKAMCDEDKPIEQAIMDSKGYVAHFHVNDANRNAPGWGNTDYAPIVQAIRNIGYDDYASVEVFDFSFDPRHIATSSIEFLKKAFG